MKDKDKLEPYMRVILRYVALGLSDEDVSGAVPEYSVDQIAKIRRGTVFKRALRSMQEEIDEELAQKMGEDGVRAFLRGKSLSMAQTLVAVADDEDAPHSARVKAADSVLAKAGYAGAQELAVTPVLMLSQEKLNAVMAPKQDLLKDVPDYVNGHEG